MDGHAIARWSAQLIGAALVGLVLLDVFLTVLYARIGTGIISHPLACLTWKAFRLLSRPFGRKRGTLLSFAGPVMLVLLIAVWVTTLTCGSGLIVWPKLGTSVVSTSGGSTPRDYASAMYIGGDSMSTAGTSDFAPRSAFFRLFYVANSFVGMFVITLTVTYLLQIYNALQSRNTFTLKIHSATGETGDAVELLAGLAPDGNFERGYSQLSEMAAEMTAFEEAHHFYPVLFYFRFREPHYAASRAALVALDAVSLIKSALDDEQYAWLKTSAAVAQLWRSATRLNTILASAFLPAGVPDNAAEPTPDECDRWRRRYFAAVRRLGQTGARTMPDTRTGAEVYVANRAKWDRYIAALARHMEHELPAVDPAGCDPAYTDAHPPIENRLRAAG